MKGEGHRVKGLKGLKALKGLKGKEERGRGSFVSMYAMKPLSE